MSAREPFIQDPAVAEYYEQGFLKELIERGGLTKKEAPTADAARFASYYGVKQLPAELEQFLRMRDEYEFVYHSLGEWRIFGDDAWLPNPGEGNLAEQVIRLDQNNYLGTCMHEYATGCVFAGTAGNGDAYLVEVNALNGRAEVLFWDHETNDIEFSIADSLSSLAYANHLLAKVKNTEDDDEDGESESAGLAGVARDFARIKDRVNLSWHYRSLEEAAGVEGKFEAASAVRFYFYRALWINFLLRNDHRSKMRSVAEAFGILDHGQMDVEKALSGPHLASTPQTAFYWLWRLFFFNKEEKLRQALEIAKAGSNPFVCDLALLIEELQNGRKDLGSIEDIHALREKFLALDLDPDRAEEREREAEEAERRAAERKADDEQRAAKMLATLNDEELIEAAWREADNEIIVKAVYDRLRTSEPELAADFVRLDFFLNQGYSRDGCFYTNEREDVLEALARNGDPRLTPLLINQGGAQTIHIAASMGGTRTLARIEPMLDLRADYHHELTAAVKAMGALWGAGQAEKLIAMIGEFNYGPDDFLKGIANKELMWALFEALAEIGDRRAAAPMAEIAASGHKDLAARAMVSLGRLGDPAALDVLLPALSGAFMRPALFALARIGDARALEPVTKLVAGRRGAPEKLIYERLMLDDLRSRCGETVALDNARFALRCVEGNKYERAELHETAVLLLARHLQGAELRAALRPVLDADEARVRHAARMALGANGKPAPVTFYDRGTVDAIFARHGAKGLRVALRDPKGVQRHNIVRKAVDENLGAALEADLIAYGRDLLLFEHGTCGYGEKWEHKTRALEAIASMDGEAAARLAHDALTHPNAMIRAIFDSCGDEVKERARRFGPLEPRRTGPAPGRALALSVEPLGKTRWSLGGMVNGMQFTADGQRLIAVGGQGGAGGAAAIFDRNGGVSLLLPGVRGWAYDVDIHPDGHIAAVSLHAGHLLLIDMQTGETLADLRGHGGVPNGVRKARFSPGGTRLASASDDRSIIIWDVAARTAIRRIHEKFDVNTVDWFPDGRRIVFGTDKQVGIVDVNDESAEIRRFDMSVAEVRVFAGGSLIAAGGSSKKGIVILNDRLEPVRTFDQRHVARIRFSADESQMFAVSWEGERLVRRWDMATGEAAALAGHDDAALFALDLDPLTGDPYAGGKKNAIMSWNNDGAARDANPDAHDSEVTSVVACSDGEIATASKGAVIRWSLKDGAAAMTRRFARASGSPMRFDAVAASPDGAILLATGFDGAAAFRAADGTELWRQPALKRSEVALGVEGAFIVGSDGALVWLDAATGQPLHVEPLRGGSWVEHLIPLPGGRALAAIYRKPEAYVFDLAARKRVATVELPVRPGKAETCRFAAGGGRLVVSRWDYSFDMLDAGTLEHRFEAQNGVYGDPLAVSPDGALVACGENELHVFEAETFDLLARQSLGGNITALCFVGPRTLAAGLANGQAAVVKIKEQ